MSIFDVQGKNGFTLIAYWLLGLCNNYGYVVMLTAAHDILSSKFSTFENNHDNINDVGSKLNIRDCNIMSTGIILLADIIPALLVKIICPFIKCSVHIRMATVVLSSIIGFLTVGSATSTSMAITGVAITSFASGLGESTLLSYTVFFKNPNILLMWSSGTGAAGIFGSFTYTALIAIGISSSTTLYVLIVIPFTMAVSFWCLMTPPSTTNEEVQITVAKENDEITTATNEINSSITDSSFTRKLFYFRKVVPYFGPLFLVYFFEYFINQGLGLNAVYLTVDSIYGLTPHIGLLFALILWEGLLGGSSYVNTFYKIQNEVEAENQEFATALTTMSDSFGICLAGFLAIPAHNFICSLPV